MYDLETVFYKHIISPYVYFLVCKYKFEDWSECDIATNTMTRKQTLKSGPSSCQQVKEYSRKCKARKYHPLTSFRGINTVFVVFY